MVMMVAIQNAGYANNVPVNPSPSCTPNSPEPTPTGNLQTPTPTPTINEPTPSPPSATVKVYGNDATVELKNIDWGLVFVNCTSTYSISIINMGNQPVKLEFAVTNWTPGVNGAVFWNYDGRNIQVGDKVTITLSLKITDATTTTFSNDIIIISRTT
jgi:hypothetical protein